MKREILIVGGGGREHALGWKLAQEEGVGRLFFAPGNAGTAQIGENIPISAEDIAGLAQWAGEHKPDMSLIGPEYPLSAGIVDEFETRGLSIFGPSKGAAQLESSKAWAGTFMMRHHISCPQSRVFTDSDAALSFVRTTSWDGVVIKADGLAAGKGVIIPDTMEQAEAAVYAMMIEGVFGNAGRTILVQERLFGPEVSALAFCDGRRAIPCILVQDHKRIFNGNRGSNTGGMGAYAPVPSVNASLFEQIHRTILQRTVDGMRKDGYPYKGILYAGLMLTKEGPKALEYNVRFGDPETQPLLMLLQSDLGPILTSCIKGTLDNSLVRFRHGFAVSVVLASKGYPESSEKGVLIQGLDVRTDPNVTVFHAGTLRTHEGVLTNGGRVLGVTAYGKTIDEALRRVYGAIGPGGICFEDMQYRNDIGHQAVS